MITAVKKIKDGVYIINDAVVISDLSFSNKQVSYNINFDQTLITDEKATLLADSFIRDALVASIESQ